jgi:ABC-2 type transport system ATP-binding protein/ribosome-dependent ATPase
MTALAATTDLVKRYGSVNAVDHVSLEVGRGEVVGLLGANGAGKTTLIRCLLGLISPTAGSVTLIGGPPTRDRLRRVGYVPQGLGLYTDLTIAENLTFRRGIFGGEAVVLDPELAPRADVVVKNLPLGMQRRAAFAAALAHRPDLLVLDEPTSGVGVLARARLWDTIRDVADRGGGVLVTTHHLEEAEQCDRLVMLSAGRVVAAGSLADVIGGRTAIAAADADPAAMLAALDRAGIDASLMGRRVRAPGADRDAVAQALTASGIAARLEEVPATLEEAFIARVAP